MKKLLWLYPALFLVAGIAIGVSNKTYIITFGDSRFCSKETAFCKPLIIKAPDELTAVKKAGITVWRPQEYADAFRLCEQKESMDLCKQTFALPETEARDRIAKGTK